MLATSLAGIKYTKASSSSFKPILNIGLLEIEVELSSSKVAWTNPYIALLWNASYTTQEGGELGF